MGRDLAPPHSSHFVDRRKRHRRRGDVRRKRFRALRSFGSYSAVHNGPLTMDVVFELGNHELLITDYAFDKIAD